MRRCGTYRREPPNPLMLLKGNAKLLIDYRINSCLWASYVKEGFPVPVRPTPKGTEKLLFMTRKRIAAA